MPSENLPYLYAVYAVTWAVFFVYVFFVSRRQREMEKEIQQLRQVLTNVEDPPGPGIQ